MSKELILFDIDKTLFDRGSLKQSFGEFYEKVAGKIEQPIDVVNKVRSEYESNLESSSDFHPEELLKYFSESFKIDKNVLDQYFQRRRMYERSLYPEVKGVLNELKNDYELGIFSEGFVDIQLNKLSDSNILEFFSPQYIFIERRKLNDNVISKLPECIIVDDKKEVVDRLKREERITPILIERKDEPKSGDSIRSLTDITDLLGFKN